MVNGNAGKGDAPRPVDKKKYDRNYLMVFGEICHTCKGTGEFVINNGQVHTKCKTCGGAGYVEKKK